LHLGNLFLIVQLHFSKLFLILKSGVNHTSRGSISTSTLPSIKLRKCSSKIITSILSFISGRLATKSNQIKQLIRNGRSASLQRTFKKSFTSFSHSTRNKTRDGLIRVRNIRALNGRFNTSITHAYSIVIGSKHITLNATGGGFLTASKQFRHGATSKSRSNTASNRSEERFSRNAETDLVCLLMLEKKNTIHLASPPLSITTLLGIARAHALTLAPPTAPVSPPLAPCLSMPPSLAKPIPALFFSTFRRPRRFTLFPYTTLFRSNPLECPRRRLFARLQTI